MDIKKGIVLFSFLISFSSFGEDSSLFCSDTYKRIGSLFKLEGVFGGIKNSCICKRPYLVPDGGRQPEGVTRTSVFNSVYSSMRYEGVNRFCGCQSRVEASCPDESLDKGTTKEEFNELVFKSYVDSYVKTYEVALENFVNIVSQHSFNSSSGMELPKSCSPSAFFKAKVSDCGDDGVSKQELEKRKALFTSLNSKVGQYLHYKTDKFLKSRISKTPKYFPPNMRQGREYFDSCLPEMYYKQSSILDSYLKHYEKVSSNIKGLCRSFNKFGPKLFSALSYTDEKSYVHMGYSQPRAFGDGVEGYFYSSAEAGVHIGEDSKNEIREVYWSIKNTSKEINESGDASGGELNSATSMFNKILTGDIGTIKTVSTLCSSFHEKEDQISGSEFVSAVVPNKDLKAELSSFCDKFIKKVPSKLLCQKNLMASDTASINRLHSYAFASGVEWNRSYDKQWCESLSPSSNVMERVEAVRGSSELSKSTSRFMTQESSATYLLALDEKNKKKREFNKLLCPVMLDCNDKSKSCRIKGIDEVLGDKSIKLSDKQKRQLVSMQSGLKELVVAKEREMMCPRPEEFVCANDSRKCCKVADSNIMSEVYKQTKGKVLVVGDALSSKHGKLSATFKDNLLAKGKIAKIDKLLPHRSVDAPKFIRKGAKVFNDLPYKKSIEKVSEIKQVERLKKLDKQFEDLEQLLHREQKVSRPKRVASNRPTFRPTANVTTSRVGTSSRITRTNLGGLNRLSSKSYDGAATNEGNYKGDVPVSIQNSESKNMLEQSGVKTSRYRGSRSMKQLAGNIGTKGDDPVEEENLAPVQEVIADSSERSPTKRRPAVASVNTVGVVGGKAASGSGARASIPSVTSGGVSTSSRSFETSDSDDENVIVEKTEELVSEMSLQKVEGDFLYLTVPSNLSDEKVPAKDRHPEYVVKMAIKRDSKTRSVVGISYARGSQVRGLLKNVDVSVLVQRIVGLLQNR